MNLNLRSLYLQGPKVGWRMIRLRVWEPPSADNGLEHLKARQRGREHWIWELKRKTLEVNTIHPMRYLSKTNLLRAHQVPLNTLQHPLQLPLRT